MDKYLRHESGRTVKIIKDTNKYTVVYFHPDVLQSNLKDSFKTLRESKKAADYFLSSGLIY